MGRRNRRSALCCEESSVMMERRVARCGEGREGVWLYEGDTRRAIMVLVAVHCDYSICCPKGSCFQMRLIANRSAFAEMQSNARKGGILHAFNESPSPNFGSPRAEKETPVAQSHGHTSTNASKSRVSSICSPNCRIASKNADAANLQATRFVPKPNAACPRPQRPWHVMS
jgi:hypothetical protein